VLASVGSLRHTSPRARFRSGVKSAWRSLLLYLNLPQTEGHARTIRKQSLMQTSIRDGHAAPSVLPDCSPLLIDNYSVRCLHSLPSTPRHTRSRGLHAAHAACRQHLPIYARARARGRGNITNHSHPKKPGVCHLICRCSLLRIERGKLPALLHFAEPWIRFKPSVSLACSSARLVCAIEHADM